MIDLNFKDGVKSAHNSSFSIEVVEMELTRSIFPIKEERNVALHLLF